ncbi:nucleoporin SONB [Coccidioides immitis RS]|uniref:Nucleoporin SONB n=2 Tax=Coccidioides immitis TaxID=5501 RepID=J3KJC7_COCIM|nr:nucleoporin SONB [Coccidioides immitis RS]EAS36157.3 nucleoporin SONB [Coccidioides immitis RS]TPX25687.1 hypothetical protein DIZ76_011143 [Coccidioides immitis]
MSGFGAGSGFGGFGSGNQQQQSGGFGTGSAFGASGSGFGAPTAQTNPIFGGQNKGFGSTPTSTGGMFGSGTSTFGNTGFGSGSSFGNTPSTGSSGMFGSNQTSGFGSGSQGSSLFGGGTTGGTGFGGGSAFGSGTALAGAIPPASGTANPPFSAYEEKDSSGTCHYQSISCMQPYLKYSFEELRVADYDQGRRYGNASGQAGAFGATAFGGFQQPAGGFGTQASSNPFGAASSAPSTFGQTATSGFGSGTSTNPLFGATKPAGSVFGQTPTSQPSGFGTTTTGTGGFGSTTGTAFGSGNLLGNQQKTGFGTGTTGTGFGGFGQTAPTTSASPFGGTTATSSPFGQQQAGSGGFSAFGQTQQSQQNKPAFSGFGTTTQQQQPAGGTLFGGTPAGTGTTGFGTSLGQQGGTSLFGGTTGQQATSTNLFGGQQQQQQEQKPNLFGNLGTGTSTTGTSGFSGFGTQPQQQPGSSLFGGTQQQQKPSLFTPSTGQTGSLFGTQASATPASTGGSLFNLGGANQNAQQQNTGGLGLGSLGSGSMFGTPQQQTQQQPQATGLQASLLEGNPYGNQSIFSGLPAPNAPSPGPLATPLSASIKQKQRTPLPMYKVSPHAANRLITPPTRQGYGFSYSTYGTPSSSIGTPTGTSLLSRSFNGGSLGRGFSKSLSASSLRRSFEPETDSILSPGAFSPGSSRYSSSNLKRLTIDRSLRNDLFARAPQPPATITNGDSTPQQSSKLKKRVSFDSPIDSEESSAKADGALVHVQSSTPEPTPEELGFLRSGKQKSTAAESNKVREVENVNGTPDGKSSASSSDQPEMEQIRGNELAIVPEDREQEEVVTPEKPGLVKVPERDPQPGEYWMKPSRQEINKMTREQQKQVSNFTVGRKNCGSVTFNKPVDLTTVNLDDVMDSIVVIGLRSITVYPEEGSKPPRGKGLNVPSTLTIENSWPRGRDKKAPSPLTSGPLFDKHIERLKRVTNTEFVEYRKDKGIWIFKVPHFTTYGLDYDDDDEGESFDQSTMSAHPDMVTPKAQIPSHHLGSEFNDSTISVDDSFDDSMIGVEDDTFEFKKRGLVPGAFTNQSVIGKSVSFESDEEQESFLGEGSVGSNSENGYVEESDGHDTVTSELESDRDETMDMAGAFPVPDYTAEQPTPISPQKSTFEHSRIGHMDDLSLNLSGNWAEQLQRTISPRKQDRQALREIQNSVFADRDGSDDTPKAKSQDSKDKGFATSIDLMNSLFRPRQASPRKSQVAKTREGFEWPYAKKPKTFAGKPGDMPEDDVSFHSSFKPRWANLNTLILRGVASPSMLDAHEPEIILYKLGDMKENQDALLLQKARSVIQIIDDVPSASLSVADFLALIDVVQEESPEGELERRVWQLAYILFNDDIEDDISAGVPEHFRKQYLHRIKKDRLSLLWEDIIRQTHGANVEASATAEERAIRYLCLHRVEDACKALIEGGNPHLATLISQAGRDETIRKDMKDQIEFWRNQNVLSEMTEPIRALYELVAGNCLRSEGKPNAAIEDRTSTFSISERFGLDWVQAFGLRLWYGIGESDSIEAAVSLFQHDISHGNEPAYPTSIFGDRREQPGADLPESPLWVILKIFAVAKYNGKHPEIQPICVPRDIMPEAFSAQGLHSRLSFQLFHHICKVARQYNALEIDEHRADQLALNYAWELAASEEYGPALFVLLYLNRAVDRERSIKEMLCQFAELLPAPVLEDETTSVMWKYLTQELRLPTPWIWAAKALFARSAGVTPTEVGCLLNARHWDEAHDTFCRVVAPRLVIERDYDTLKLLLDVFGKTPERRIRGWPQEGGLYRDFLALVDVPGIRKDQAVLKRLTSTLINAGEKIEKSTTVPFEEKVALKEIGRLVAGWCTNDIGSTLQPADILRLPMTQDARRIHAAEVSKRYYRAIMASGA